MSLRRGGGRVGGGGLGCSRTTDGLYARTSQRICALNAAIWHNWLTDQPIKRSLTAYDH